MGEPLWGAIWVGWSGCLLVLVAGRLAPRVCFGLGDRH